MLHLYLYFFKGGNASVIIFTGLKNIRMKKILLVFIILNTVNISIAQNKDSIAIRQVMDKQVRAWNNGNIEAFMQTYWKSDSLLFVSNPPLYGWQSTLDRYKKAYPDTIAMGKLSFDLLQLQQLSPEYYFVLGKWDLKRSTGKNSGGYFTLLFRKINHQWVIIADHTS
jgi:ketosteroid isomerase-like protein